MNDISFTASIRTYSEANGVKIKSLCKNGKWKSKTEHWTEKRKRHNRNKFILGRCLKFWCGLVLLPIHITITRIAPRKLDDDNLPQATKHLRDCIADYFIPGLAPGRADGDSRLTWSYEQEKGKPNEYAVRITIKKI